MEYKRVKKLNCPHCGHPDSRVVQGWSDEDGYARRRKCEACRGNYQTVEALSAYQPKPTRVYRSKLKRVVIAALPHPGVYFVLAQDGRIKVGASGDVASRVRSLEAEFNAPLTPLCYIPTVDKRSALKVERIVHRDLAGLRADREWFIDHPTLRQLIDSAKPWPVPNDQRSPEDA